MSKILWLCLFSVSLFANAPKSPAFQKVMIVIFENENNDKVIDLPFFSKLAIEGAMLTNFHAETHPSQPNYIALVSGDRNGCYTDSKIDINARSVADLIEAKGKSWKVYAESYPGGCFQGMESGTYVRRHNPFISFKNIQSNRERCGHIVEASELKKDIAAGTLPDFSFYVPDINNDGHDTDAKYADRWYETTFGPLLKDPHFTKGMLLVTTFDESEFFQFSNHIYTSVWGEAVKAGSTSKVKYNHYNLLRTIEDGLDLGTLGKNDTKAASISDIWK